MRSNVSLLRRLGAISYDIFLSFSLVFFIIGVILIIFSDKHSQNNILIFVIAIVSIYFYFTWSWVKGGQTLGMRAWKFKIVQSNNAPITHAQALLRFTLAWVSFGLFGLGFFYQLWDENRLTLHDKYSHTQLMKN